MDKLIKKRKAMIAKIEALRVVVDQHATTPLSRLEVLEHQKKIPRFVKNNENLFTEIAAICKDDDEIKLNEAPYAVEDAKLTAISIQLTTILELFTSTSTSGHSTTTAEVKLPKLDLPTFSGNPQDWISFSDLFTAAVHSNTKYTETQKLQYLKSCVKNEPELLIKSLQITDANYDEAWKILTNRYQNLRVILNANMDRLLSQQAIGQENPVALRKLVDITTECVRAFTVLKVTPEQVADILIVHLISKKLDQESRLQWERSIKKGELPTVKNFCEFLDEHARITTAAKVGTSKAKDPQSQKKPNATLAVHHGTIDNVSKNKCVMCKGDHILPKCKDYLTLSVDDRTNIVKEKCLCFNCLKYGHGSQDCESGGCRKCNKRHHTSIHREYRGKAPVTPNQSNETQIQSSETLSQTSGCQHSAPLTNLMIDTPRFGEVIIMTAMVKIVDFCGNEHMCRAMIDSASTASIISSKCVQRLGLKRHKIYLPITGLAGHGVGSSRSYTQFKVLSSQDKDFSVQVNALVFDKVTNKSPNFYSDPKKYPHLNGLQLADPTYKNPGDVDVLLGGDVFGELFLPGVLKGAEGSPTAMLTVFGWALIGKTTGAGSVSINHIDCNLDATLQRFWEVEEIPKKNSYSPEEAACEKHFEATHSRDSTGRYKVRLPFRENRKPLGESRYNAVKRLNQLERRFPTNSELKKTYSDVIQEYLDLNHMEEVPASELEDTSKEVYYLPHHVVIKPSSTTTKYRVVFDASALTSLKTSLNENLMVGPRLQQDLTSILLRFRIHQVALSADIAKMYRQFRVHEEDVDYQRMVWRKSFEEPIKDYRLLTATFGTSAAPYLAVKCVQQLAKDENGFPEASKVLLNDLYVDDLMTGAADDDKAIKLKEQLMQLTQRGNLELRKWSSNSTAVLQSLPQELRETQLPLRIDTDETVKTLGIVWNPATDSFSFSVVPPPNRESLTKRLLLSDLAKVFDPLGWLSPTTIKAKIVFQSLWKSKLSWDDKLPDDITAEWMEYTQNLPAIQQIKLERFCLQPGEHSKHQLIGFCDASEKAYSAVVYIRSWNPAGEVKVKLMAAKTKVAPIKQITLPRLELCGAVLLTRLTEAVRESLSLAFEEISFWTDSTIVLAWISAPPHRWKTFVANRVAEIQETSIVSQWNHVSSECNPADCASRGISPSELVAHPLWWHGPDWLSEINISDCAVLADPDEIEVSKEERLSATVNFTQVDVSLLERYSDLRTLVNVTAYCRRFISNCLCASPGDRTIGPLTPEEYKSALLVWIKKTQRIEFEEEIHALEDKKDLPSRSKLLCLTPFLDSAGVLRVGGRLENASLTPDRKHPILLPRKSMLTTLIVNHEHVKNFHAGPQLLLSSLQQQYWILCGRDVVRRLIQKCVRCHRQRATIIQPLMGNLPSARVTPSRPFIHCGVDYAGPWNLKATFLRARGPQKTMKAYIALFICLATRAIHFELVTSLSTEHFLESFRRFTSRRGKPSDVYSDCGTNFIGANRQLKEFLELVKSKVHNDVMASQLTPEGIKWHFNPPSGAHFGGLWEAGVKSVKFHLRRVVGDRLLTYEEMLTILNQVEACLNSRPLTALSNNPQDLSALTPGHFLIGSSINAIPESDVTHLPENRLSRFQLTQQIVQHFWKRWTQEYLTRLQQRPKWWTTKRNLAVGELVLLKEDDLPPTKWKLGRILQIHPGEDEIVRAVTVKTATGNFIRPVVKLSPLPIDAEL